MNDGFMSGRPTDVEISVLYYVGVELAVIRAAYAAVVARAYRVAFLFVFKLFFDTYTDGKKSVDE